MGKLGVAAIESHNPEQTVGKETWRNGELG